MSGLRLTNTTKGTSKSKLHIASSSTQQATVLKENWAVCSFKQAERLYPKLLCIRKLMLWHTFYMLISMLYFCFHFTKIMKSHFFILFSFTILWFPSQKPQWFPHCCAQQLLFQLGLIQLLFSFDLEHFCNLFLRTHQL